MIVRVGWGLSLSILLATAAGCAAPPDDDARASSACEANPETSLQPQRLAGNGQNLNGQNLNRIAVNGSNLNGENLNGVALNGQNLNGQNLNGQNLNKIAINGSNLNGQNLNGVQVNGASNEIVATTEDGRVLGGEALVGLTLRGVTSSGAPVDLVIASFERRDDVAYYGITFEGRNVCDGDDKGMFVPGVWDATAARHDRLTVGATEITTSFSCRTGAIAKCVTWGYAPWKVGADLHQACTRMVRADYCGTGVSFTKDNTLIDVYDTKGIQLPTLGDASLAFEAGWGPNGAVCASRTRFSATARDGASVMPSCWDSLPKCGSFDEAKAAGATIANGSRIQSRLLCD